MSELPTTLPATDERVTQLRRWYVDGTAGRIPAETRAEVAELLARIDADAKVIAELRARWRPIETAPRDGTVVIGYPSRYATGMEFIRWDGVGWIDPLTHSVRPSHWMPLPESPSCDESRRTR